MDAKSFSALEQGFMTYADPLNRMEMFKYCEQVVPFGKNNVPATRRNIKRTHIV